MTRTLVGILGTGFVLLGVWFTLQEHAPVDNVSPHLTLPGDEWFNSYWC